MSSILDKNLDEFIDLFNGFFPTNQLIFKDKPLDATVHTNRRILYKILFENFFNSIQLIQHIYDGYFLQNDLLLDRWLVELGLPDLIFTDLDTNDKKRAAIIAKKNLKNIYGKNDVKNIMSLIGIEIEFENNATKGNFPKDFPFMFVGSGFNTRFVVCVKILDNPKNYSQTFIKQILDILTSAFEYVVITS